MTVCRVIAASLLAVMLAACGARTLLLVGDGGVAPSGTCHDAIGNALCGGGACAVLDQRDVLAAFTTNDSPSIALDESGAPVILVETDTTPGAYTAVVVRSPTSTLPVPVALATGSLSLGGPGPLALAAYDGAFHTTLLTLTSSGFTIGDTVPTDQIVSSGNLWHDAHGTLHLVAEAGTGHGTSGPVYFRHDSAGFHAMPLDPGVSGLSGGVLALGPGGIPNVAWQSRGDGMAHSVRWWADGAAAPETVFSGSSAFGGPLAITVGLGGGSAVGDMATVALFDDTGALVLATRSPSGGWHTTPVTPPFEGACFMPRTCTDLPVAFDILPSCDGPRVIYGEVVRAPDGSSSARILVSRPGAVPGDADVLIEHAGARNVRGHAIRTAGGDFHVAYYVGPLADGTYAARYLHVGAAP